MADKKVVNQDEWQAARQALLTTFNWLDFTPLGRQEEDGTMHWIRRHDEYNNP